ncbi:transporter [Streptomyces sp. 6N223]|uniref:transporter n=1 Tax=Streptomyces sp. 6N223 TaxID=3457412 RepID=UPI003FD392B3
MSATAVSPANASSTGSVTRTFVRLKLALLRNGARRTTGRSAAFLGTVALTVVFGGLGLLTFLSLRGHEHVADGAIAVVAVIALAWAFMPFFVSGIDETLDPGRLAMLPLRPRPLIVALLVASVVGVGPLFTLLLVLGAALAIASGAAGWAAAAVAVPLTLLVCTTLARALATANARLLSSRRGRDLAILSGVVIALGIQAVNIAISRLSGEGGIGPIEAMADVARWLPPASAIDAMRAASEESYGVAALGLGGTAAALALLLWWWAHTLTRLMTSPDSSTLQPDSATGAASRTRPARSRAGAWLPEGRTGTVMLRTLRYAWRDPKTKMGWVMALSMGLVMPVVFAVQGSASVYHACWAAALLGLMMYNQFGQDYSAFWLVAQTISGPRDAFVELRARAYAVALIAVPYTVLVVVISAAVIGSWGALPDATGIALAVLGALFGAGAISSARFPYSIPQDNPMQNVASGQGAVAYFSIFGGAAVGGALCAPVIGLAVWLRAADSALVWTVLPVGVGYGVLLAYAGLRAAAGPAHARIPEILQAVSRA